MPRLAPKPESDPSVPPSTPSTLTAAQSEEKPLVFAVITPDTLYAHKTERYTPRPYFILSGVLEAYSPFFSTLDFDDLLAVSDKSAIGVRAIIGSQYHPLKHRIFDTEHEARAELKLVFETDTRGTIALDCIEVHTVVEEQAYLAFREEQKRGPFVDLSPTDNHLFGRLW